jgi:hypothetical protein
MWRSGRRMTDRAEQIAARASKATDYPGYWVTSEGQVYSDVEWLLAERERLRSYEPCDPCKREDHANCTGDCPSMCCGLADAEAQNERLLRVVEAAREMAVQAAINDDMDDTAFYEAVGDVCVALAALKALES